MTKKVLIISYYWPPSGGSGVQRWLKLAKYLVRLGVEPIVLTVDPKYAAYPFVDSSLEHDVVNGVTVYRTKAFNPIGIGTRIMGSKSTPKAGFAGGKRKGLIANISLFLRTHFFIPDPRKGWNGYAFKKALDIIDEHNPDVIITTGPPQSTHLIGLKLKDLLGVKWIADFRDPWTDIYYYNLLNHTMLSRYIDKRMEANVINSANSIVTVSEGVKSLIQLKLSNNNINKPIAVIPNGYDPDDFARVTTDIQRDEIFTITYLGSLAKQYNPSSFFDAVSFLLQKGISIRLRFIGTIAQDIIQEMNNMKLLPGISFHDYIPHTQVPKTLAQSHALLLLIPETANDQGILTGKLFEYLASRRPIVALGSTNGDASRIIDYCKAGKMFDRNESNELKQYLMALAQNSLSFSPDESKIQEFSRSKQAESLIDFIDR